MEPDFLPKRFFLTLLRELLLQEKVVVILFFRMREDAIFASIALLLLHGTRLMAPYSPL